MPLIWVIDDDASSRELLARVLVACGWQVEQLTDGREALDQLAAGAAPDLVISDIRMGEVDGLAVTEAFRRDAPATPVILVTAFGNVDGAVEAIRRGAFDYVSKPYDVDAVQHTAARAL
jgi:DNA-binding NtrC family response regulator